MNEFTDRPPEPDVEKKNFKKGSPVKAIRRIISFGYYFSYDI
jgi:hypothetical protein